MQQQHDKRTQNTLATIMFCHNALCTATHHFSPEDVLNSISDFYWIDSRNDKVKSDFICICVRKRNSSWWSDASFVFGFNACLISLCPGCGCRHQWFCAVLFTKGPVGHNAVGSFVLMHLRAHHKGQPSCNQTIVGDWNLLMTSDSILGADISVLPQSGLMMRRFFPVQSSSRPLTPPAMSLWFCSAVSSVPSLVWVTWWASSFHPEWWIPAVSTKTPAARAGLVDRTCSCLH